MKNFEQLAREGYEAYCKQAGGKTFDDKPLPAFAELGAQRQACWLAAAKQIVAAYAVVH